MHIRVVCFLLRDPYIHISVIIIQEKVSSLKMTMIIIIIIIIMIVSLIILWFPLDFLAP